MRVARVALRTLSAWRTVGILSVVLLLVVPGVADGVEADPSHEPDSEIPSGVSGDWWGEVQEGLRRSEYHIELRPASYRPKRGNVYQAPNRAHNLRLYFDERGVEVLDRTEKDAPTLARLELARWGRAGAMQSASPGRLRS